MKVLQNQIKRLYEIVIKLRDPQDGCPWDLKQTHKSLLKYLMEESYEFMHAVDKDDYEHMEDELGDILLQVVFHAVIAEQNGKFNLEDVAKGIANKMERRHPHVFGDIKTKDIKKIKDNWETIKANEKKSEKQRYQIGTDLLAFPALTSAVKIGKKTNMLNFDWENFGQVVCKVEEEWQEMKEELKTDKSFDENRVKEELGDLLFSMAQLARHLKIDPELALREANIKFKRRFDKLEDNARERNIDIKKSSQDKLEQLWQEVKTQEKNNLKIEY